MYDYTDLESCHQAKETKSYFRKLRYKKIVWMWLFIKLFTSETQWKWNKNWFSSYSNNYHLKNAKQMS